MTPAPLQLGQAPSELALNSAGFTPLAFANALRIGSSSPVYVAGLLRLEPRIAPWSIETTHAPAGIDPCTSELLPEPATLVNTVSRRFGISTLTSLRLFSRAPCTRIRSRLSATCSTGDCVSVLVAVLIVSPSPQVEPPSRSPLRRLARSDQLRAVPLVLLRRRGRGNGAGL